MRFADPEARSGECRAWPHLRVILFFWPIRASSWNRISILPTSVLFRARLIQARWEVFKILDGSLGLCMMAGVVPRACGSPSREAPAQRLFGDRDAELLVDPLRKIDQPPAHYTVDRRDRAALDHPHNRTALHID